VPTRPSTNWATNWATAWGRALVGGALLAACGGPPVGRVGVDAGGADAAPTADLTGAAGTGAGPDATDSVDRPADAPSDVGSEATAELGGEAAPPPTCPTTPPLEGDLCTGIDCTYDDCGGRGLTVARCHPEGTFEVQTTPCTAPTCIGIVRRTCAIGQICRATGTGGDLDAECVGNPCGRGPISCACACPGACTIVGGSSGITVTCAPTPDAGTD
jgi:hypothetical protein